MTSLATTDLNNNEIIHTKTEQAAHTRRLYHDDKYLEPFISDYKRRESKLEALINQYPLEELTRAYNCLLYTSPSPRD